MKRFFFTALFTLSVLFSFAQDIPSGTRFQLTEFEQDEDKQYSVFRYKDEDGTIGYYLSLGHSDRILEVYYKDNLTSSVDLYDEVCLYLGATIEEANASINSFLELLEKETGTTIEFPCRLTTGGDILGEHSTTTCTIVKRFLEGKRLCFRFKSWRHTAEADLTKSALKALRFGLKIDKKIHKNNR